MVFGQESPFVQMSGEPRGQSGDREHRFRHVLGAQRFREGPYGWLNWTAVQDLGIHQPRTDHAGPNAVLLFLYPGRVGQPGQTELGSLVDRTRNIGEELPAASV